MKTRFIMKPCYCDRLVKAIDNYIQKADNDLSDLLGKEGYAKPKKTLQYAKGIEDDVADIIGFGKVSATLLSEMLQAYTGSPSDIKLEPFDDRFNNKLYISTSPKNEFSFLVSDVLDILSKKVPAHIPFSIAFTYQPEAPPAYIAVAQLGTAMSCTIRLPGVIKPRAVGATAYTAGAAASARMMAEVEIPGIITPKSVSAQAYAAGRLAHTHETVTITIGGQTT